MPNPITIGRWRIELYQRAIYIQQQANPRCAACEGSGAIETGSGEYLLDHHWAPETEPCDCWDPYSSLRIPLWRKPAQEAWPF
jgi:hypothetical protein